MNSHHFTVGELAERIGGSVEGDADLLIRDIKPISESGEGDITFVADPRYEAELRRTGAACVVLAPGSAVPEGQTVIRHANPKVAFAMLVGLLRPAPRGPEPGVHQGASVSPEAVLGEGASVGSGAVVEAGARIGAAAIVGPLSYVGVDAEIGDETRLHPRVVLYHGVKVGRRCILHAGCVLGADGFGYATDKQGRHHKIPQAGTVVVEDEVEIGANTTVDRAVLGETRIGRGSKIDNLVQIAHNVTIGPGSIVVAQTGIAGSTRLGAGVVVGAQAGIVGHLELGDRAMIAAQAGVTKNVPAGSAVLGGPAVPAGQGKRAYALIARLPELKKQIADLRKRVQGLEERSG